MVQISFVRPSFSLTGACAPALLNRKGAYMPKVFVIVVSPNVLQVSGGYAVNFKILFREILPVYKL